MGFAPENQVRTGLPGGGKWIRTFGPSQGMSQIRTVGAERDIGRRKRRFLYGGTDGSNPVPSSGESGANLSLAGIRLPTSRSRGFPRVCGPGRAGGSLIVNSCEEWERTFNVCWGSVYNGTRAFLPLLLKAEEGHIVNASSVNGFWASIGPHLPQTAYAAAKFAVKGFTEALITDLRINAPHIKCSVVM